MAGPGVEPDDAGRRPASMEERLAGRLSPDGGPPPGTRTMPPGTRTMAVGLLREFGQADRAVYRAIAGTPTPLLDPPMRRLSRAADRSVLWLGIAAAMAATGGRAGRRAAAAGVAAVAADSALVNLGFKFAARRSRPDRVGAGVPVPRQVPMPHSASFPSGHTASAFAFANAVSQTVPVAGAPLRLLASAVGYSRVHTGVHYPGDVLIGAMIGASVGEFVGWGMSRAAQRRDVTPGRRSRAPRRRGARR